MFTVSNNLAVLWGELFAHGGSPRPFFMPLSSIALTLQEAAEVRCLCFHPGGDYMLVGTEHPTRECSCVLSVRLSLVICLCRCLFVHYCRVGKGTGSQSVEVCVNNL